MSSSENEVGSILTDEQLTAIDVIVSQGDPTFCEHSHPDVDLFEEMVRAAGFVAYACLPDFRARRAYERSLWALRSDGRCVPELYVLATLRFGTLPANVHAWWKDGRSSNKVLENVLLQRVPDPSEDGRVLRNQFGVKSGTAEYRKLYYSKPANKERQKLHARNSAARKRVQVGSAKAATEPEKLQEMCTRILLPDGRRGEEDDKLFALLNDPQVVQRLVNSAKLLMSIVDELTFEEALTQTRDKYLDSLTARTPLEEA